MRRVFCFIAAVLWLTGPSLFADSLTYTEASSGGHFTYDFTLTNTGTTGGTLFDLFLSLPTDISNIDTGTIGTPVGWGDPTGGLLFFGPDVNPSTSFIEWSADGSGSYDLSIGSSLTGFLVTLSQPINTPILFAVDGLSSFATATAATPEPATAWFSMASLGLLLFARRRYRE